MLTAIGRALRWARTSRGLTLKDVSARSGGQFKPSSVAGYERAERAVKLDRFCSLCEIYGIEPERLLARIVREAAGVGPVVIDTTKLSTLDEPAGAVIDSFVDRVRSLRSEPPGETLRLRSGDLEVLATFVGRRPEELADQITVSAPEAGPADRSGAGPALPRGSASTT
jgi:transcriptional regulator with XRE-family HTH domain